MRRASAALRRWVGRSPWRAAALVAGLGTVAGCALIFTIPGPFWGQALGGLFFLVLAVVVVSGFDGQPWLRAGAAFLFFAPLMVLVAVVGPMYDAAFSGPTRTVEARRIMPIPSSTGCSGVYAYVVDGTAYRTISGWNGCPKRLLLEVSVDDPQRARAPRRQTGPPPVPSR